MRPPFRPWRGLAYRAHDPRWAFAPSSGEGARLKGGRFNRRGQPALYLALATETALREAQAGFPYRFQPMTLCAYEVEAERILDGTEPAALAAAGLAPNDLACAWREALAEGRMPDSWLAAERLLAAGAQGLLYPSFAIAGAPTDTNLVLWRWAGADGARVMPIDDEGRLRRPAGAP